MIYYKSKRGLLHRHETDMRFNATKPCQVKHVSSSSYDTCVLLLLMCHMKP
jgi:hypothetical protein